jgi:hypothetical protein
MITRRKSAILIILSCIFLLQGCVSSITSLKPEVSPTLSPTISPSASLSVLSTPTLTPTASTTFPEGKDLSFQTITRDNYDVYQGKSPQILVVTTDQVLPKTNSWIKDTDVSKLNAVDYSKYFAVIAFNGFLGYWRTDFEIKRIIQNERTIYVIAHFSTTSETTAPRYSSQCHIVQVSKNDMSQYGEIIFKLLDEFRQEKANIIQNIKS